MDTVTASLCFCEPLQGIRLRYYAHDTSRDVMNVKPHDASISNARKLFSPPSLDVEGFTVVPHKSAVRDFRHGDAEEIRTVHAKEMRQLLLDLTGADEVKMREVGIVRSGKENMDTGVLNVSRPARYVHVDISDGTAAAWIKKMKLPEGKRIKRTAHFNVWRALTPPPQDIPLAICDARTLADEDLTCADGLLDDPNDGGRVVRSYEALVVRHNREQRWWYYADMRSDEVLVFKMGDSEPGAARYVAHGAFDNPLCPAGTESRASFEMRGTAFWYE